MSDRLLSVRKYKEFHIEHVEIESRRVGVPFRPHVWYAKERFWLVKETGQDFKRLREARALIDELTAPFAHAVDRVAPVLPTEES